MDGTGDGRQRRALWGLFSLLLVAGIAAALFLGGKSVERDEAAASSEARTVATLELAPILSTDDLTGPVGDERYGELFGLIQGDVIDDRAFTALTLWSPDATIVFSTDREALGEHVAAARERVKRVMREGAESVVSGETFQTWVPIRLKLDGPVVAVAEFDRPYQELWNAANRPWRLAAIGLGVLLLFSGAMFGFTFWPAPGSRLRGKKAAQKPVALPFPDAEAPVERPRRAPADPAAAPTYAQPGFKEAVQARETAEARAMAAEERADRLQQDFEKALQQMRSLQQRLQQLEPGAAIAPGAAPAGQGAVAVSPGSDPDLEATLRRMEQRAEAAERRAEIAEAKAAEDRGGAERIAALEAELAQLRVARDQLAAMEGQLGELRSVHDRAVAAEARARAAEAQLAQMEASGARAGDAERQLAEASSRIAGLEADLGELCQTGERLAELEAEIAGAEDRVKVAEGAVGAARGENQALWNRLVEADQKVEEVQAEGRALEAKVRELEAALAEAPHGASDPGAELRLREAEDRTAAAEQRALAAEERVREIEARIQPGPGDPEAEAKMRQAEERARLAEERFAEITQQLHGAEERANKAERELQRAGERSTGEGTPGDGSELQQALAATQERLRRAGERLQATEERARATEHELERVRSRLEEAEGQARRTKMEEALRALRGDAAGRDAPAPSEAAAAPEAAATVADPPIEDRRASGPFMKALSLEAKNSLSGILGVILALKHTHDPDDQQSLLRKLQTHAKKLDHVVHDLVDADRLARGSVELRRRRTDLDALVRRVIEETDLEADRNVELHSQKLVISVDPVRVEQIVTALLAGAVNRTGPGGHIWVRVKGGDGGALIAVEDEELSSDVALSPVVLRLADLHGGWAKVEGRPSGGSSFRVFLPERGPAAEAVSGSEAEPDVQASAG